MLRSRQSCLDAFVDVVNANLDIIDYAGRELKSKECSLSESNLELVEALSICFRLISTWMSVDAGSILDHVLNIVGRIETIIVSCRACHTCHAYAQAPPTAQACARPE